MLCATQGDYLGFRSEFASGKYVQARRKGGPLGFFNTNLGKSPNPSYMFAEVIAFSNTLRLDLKLIIVGIWEHWEVTEGNLEESWQTSQFTFRSRQLPQVGTQTFRLHSSA